MPVNVALNNGIGYFAQLSAIQLCRFPASFAEVLLYLTIMTKEFVLKLVRYTCKEVSHYAIFAGNEYSTRFSPIGVILMSSKSDVSSQPAVPAWLNMFFRFAGRG